ncbi:lactonase family protein [Achromobacter deleyi]|uniref:lactonase family protein n=1 Tax=Achromobacter deleyi TaxID=1353891 RepID=UPI001490B527|nr:YncE family protein [Achromobacter deleyi]QVQ28349.1 YncE family protein [Achromobacter deleyi]UIP18450.1 YncE family protein [Achromobacter deleyi]
MNATRSPHFLLVGNDEKVTWDDGQIRFLAPGRDTLSIFDAGANPAAPELVATLPLPNSLFGPPVNLAVTPDQRLALVADSMAWPAREDGQGWQPAPGRDLYVIDLAATPPAVTQTLQAGLQPSGLSINRAGTLALVANKAGRSVSVLRIAAGRVEDCGEIDMGTAVVAVSFAADGKRAFAVKTDTHRLGVLHIDESGPAPRVTHDPAEDLTTGLVPFNLVVSPDGGLALVVDMGSPTASDGHADSISVVDLSSTPPRVVDRLMVEDGPEGIAISPDGRHAAVAIVQGSNNPSSAWFHHPRGQIVLLRIEGLRVTRAGAIEVGALPEGLAFSPDSRFLYVGNFLDASMQVLAVGDDGLSDTGTRIALPGHPASMRGPSY